MDHKEVDLARHPVVGLVFQVGDAEKFPQALRFEGLDPCLRVRKQGLCLRAIEEDGGDKRYIRYTIITIYNEIRADQLRVKNREPLIALSLASKHRRL